MVQDVHRTGEENKHHQSFFYLGHFMVSCFCCIEAGLSRWPGGSFQILGLYFSRVRYRTHNTSSQYVCAVRPSGGNCLVVEFHVLMLEIGCFHLFTMNTGSFALFVLLMETQFLRRETLLSISFFSRVLLKVS
jgi:hypothetical protein